MNCLGIEFLKSELNFYSLYEFRGKDNFFFFEIGFGCRIFEIEK